MAEAEVAMVPMQNQDPADFSNRIGSKVEVQTKNPSATAEKETTSLFDLNQKSHRRERPTDRKTKHISFRNGGRQKQRLTHNGGRSKQNTFRFRPASNAIKGK